MKTRKEISSLQRLSAIRFGVVFTSSLLFPALLAGTAESPAPPSLESFMTQHGYTAVPIKWGAQNHALMTAKLNGRTVHCIVDTASENFVDTLWESELRSAGTNKVTRYGMLEKIPDKLPSVYLDRLELKGAVFTNLQALVHNLHRDLMVHTGSLIPRHDSGEQQDVLLGVPFLKAAHAWIDCPGARLYVREDPPGETLAQVITKSFAMSGFQSVTVIRVPNGCLLARAVVNGKSALFWVDTGSPFTLFDLAQLSEFGLSSPTHLSSLDDASGTRTSLNFTRPNTFKLADFELKKFPIGVLMLERLEKPNEQLQRHGVPRLVGFLGPDILVQFAALIDCDQGRIFLMRHAAYN